MDQGIGHIGQFHSYSALSYVILEKFVHLHDFIKISHVLNNLND